MDIFTRLSHETKYTMPQLQGIITGWVIASLLEEDSKVSLGNGHVEEDGYTKQSIYSLLYSLYRSVGTVKSEHGVPYEFTFNTWGYDWPKDWGNSPSTSADPERFGRNAYTGLYQFQQVQDYVREKDGRVHVVELGCGTGAGANHVCRNVLPRCTYVAVDMQAAGINTCQTKFARHLDGRLFPLRADCTKLPMDDEVADFVAVCETHVTEIGGTVTPEDQAFFGTAHRILKPGGYLVWGNAIPDDTWEPCFEYLNSIGLKVLEVRDVNEEAVRARHLDEARIQTYIDQCLDKFVAFRLPVVGNKRRQEAEIAMKNFVRQPGTNLYNDMATRADTYKVVLAQKVTE